MTTTVECKPTTFLMTVNSETTRLFLKNVISWYKRMGFEVETRAKDCFLKNSCAHPELEVMLSSIEKDHISINQKLLKVFRETTRTYELI